MRRQVSPAKVHTRSTSSRGVGSVRRAGVNSVETATRRCRRTGGTAPVASAAVDRHADSSARAGTWSAWRSMTSIWQSSLVQRSHEEKPMEAQVIVLRPKFCRHGSKLTPGGAACTCDATPPRCTCGHVLSHGACPQCEPPRWRARVLPQPGDPQLVEPCLHCGGECHEPEDPAQTCRTCEGTGGRWT